MSTIPRVPSHPDQFPADDVFALPAAHRLPYDALRLRFGNQSTFTLDAGASVQGANHARSISLGLLRAHVTHDVADALRDWLGERREYLGQQLSDIAVRSLRAGHDPQRLAEFATRQAAIAVRIKTLTAAFDALQETP